MRFAAVIRYGLLLDSGALFSPGDWTTRAQAVAAVKRWRKSRREGIMSGNIAYPRNVVCIVRIKPHRADTIASKGGHARAAKLSAKRRSEIAKKATNARWSVRRGGAAGSAAANEEE